MAILNHQPHEIRSAVGDDSRLIYLTLICSWHHLLRPRHRRFNPRQRDLPAPRFFLGMVCQNEVHGHIMHQSFPVANFDYAPIVVNGPLAIEGLVVGLIRDGRTL